MDADDLDLQAMPFTALAPAPPLVAGQHQDQYEEEYSAEDREAFRAWVKERGDYARQQYLDVWGEDGLAPTFLVEAATDPDRRRAQYGPEYQQVCELAVLLTQWRVWVRDAPPLPVMPWAAERRCKCRVGGRPAGKEWDEEVGWDVAEDGELMPTDRKCLGCGLLLCKACQPEAGGGKCYKCNGPVWADSEQRCPAIRNPQMQGY